MGPNLRMWWDLRYNGIDEAEIAWFSANPCPPDIIGINYYITSERFLDERLERYPARTHGGNGQDAYADVEAVRVRRKGIAGPETLLREAWERYRRPMAITEAHLGGEPDEQVRWLHEIWQTAHAVQRRGVDLRALTDLVAARRVQLAHPRHARGRITTSPASSMYAPHRPRRPSSRPSSERWRMAAPSTIPRSPSPVGGGAPSGSCTRPSKRDDSAQLPISLHIPTLWPLAIRRMRHRCAPAFRRAGLPDA